MAEEGRAVKGFDDAERPKFHFLAQTKALTIKLSILQKRNMVTNICQCVSPLLMLLFLFLIQLYINSLVNGKIDEEAHPLLRSPFYLLTAGVLKVEDENPKLVTANMTMLYTYDPEKIDPAKVGNPGSGDSGLLSQDTGSQLLVKFYEYQEYDVLAKDIDDLANFNASTTIQYEQTIDDLESVLFDAWKDDPQYSTGFNILELDYAQRRFAFECLYNETLTRGVDLHAIMGFIVDKLSMSLGSAAGSMFFQGVKPFPQPEDDKSFDLASLAGPFFYTLILHQLLPVFISAIVYEKEFRLREIMKMMGLKMPVYWLIQYIFDYFMYLGVMIFLIIGGYIFQFRYFTVNEFGVYFILFLIWGHCLVALSFLLSVFFAKSRTSTIVGYFALIGITFFSSFLLDDIISDPDTPRSTVVLISLIPSFALYRGLVYLSMEVSFDGPGFKMENLSNSTLNMSEVYGFLVLGWFIMMVLALYFELVIPSGFGIKRKPWFFINYFRPSYWRKKSLAEESKKLIDEIYPEGEPNDVRAERQDTYKKYDTMVRVLNIRKQFPGLKRGEPKIAVHHAALHIPHGECLGLLGHNGAGKTTLINILSGLFPPSSGTARIHGYDLREDIDQIHMEMGVCPQSDVIWPNLSGREHLQFYGRLKNMKGKELEKAVHDALADVQLLEAQRRRAGGYSGGMKRRLSVAISLLGNPSVVYMDEPSTGLDPASKHLLWDVINRKKRECALVLTTHSMEEAELLCDRIGIMAGGKLRAIGVSADLKARFGSGFRLTTHSPVDREPEVDAFIKSLLPSAELMNQLAGTRNYRLPKKDVSLARVFDEMTKARDKLGITDWGISNTTLEEVFLEISRQVEEDERHEKDPSSPHHKESKTETENDREMDDLTRNNHVTMTEDAKMTNGVGNGVIHDEDHHSQPAGSTSAAANLPGEVKEESGSGDEEDA